MQVEFTATATSQIAEHGVANAVGTWQLKVEAATWGSIMDIRNTFASVSPADVASGRTALVFNIKGNNYRLISMVSYPAQVVVVHFLLTHAEYDKNKWKGQL